MATADDKLLLPGGLLKPDETYGGTSDSLKALNLYTWTGSLLPTTEAEYCTRLGIASVKPSLATMTTNLINTYKTVSEHLQMLYLAKCPFSPSTQVKSNSDTFRFTTYPQIVGIANNVYDFAMDSGGNVTDSYYASILDLLNQLNTAATKSPPAPQSELDGYKADINDLVNYQVNAIKAIQAKADTCVTALQNYEQLCGVDKSNLETSMKAFTDKLSGTSGDIAAEEAQVAAKRKELADKTAEYEQG